MALCGTCGANTSNPKYCSRGCAAVYANSKSPKRKRTRLCPGCGTPITTRRKWCEGCSPKQPRAKNTAGQRTLDEIHKQISLRGKHPSWKNSEVRSHCRTINSHRPRVCEVCGYSKHVEFAHKRAIKDFSGSATLNEVNDPDNVRILCPNHHWEFDHGILDECPRTGPAS